LVTFVKARHKVMHICKEGRYFVFRSSTFMLSSMLFVVALLIVDWIV